MLETLKGNINVGNTWRMWAYPGQCEIAGMFVVVVWRYISRYSNQGILKTKAITVITWLDQKVEEI